jgi:hypothetical protein
MQRDAQRGCGDDSRFVLLRSTRERTAMPSQRLRVARSTLERKIVKKYNFVLKAKHFLVLEGYDPRIHAVFFCPQLYKYDPEKNSCLYRVTRSAD